MNESPNRSSVSDSPPGPKGAGVRDILWALLLTMAWPAAAAVSLSLSVAVGVREVTGQGLLLVACGTMAAYGLDRLIDSRGRDKKSLRRALAICVLLAATGTAVLACTAWWRFKVCAVLGVMAGAYVPLKRHVPKNVLTAVAWATAVATLPFAGPPQWNPGYCATVLAVAFIIGANTTLCDIPDVRADRLAGVLGITPWFGRRAGAVAAGAFGCLGALIAGSTGRWELAVTALGLAILAVLFTRNPARSLYRLLADGIVTALPGPFTLLFR